LPAVCPHRSFPARSRRQHSLRRGSDSAPQAESCPPAVPVTFPVRSPQSAVFAHRQQPQARAAKRIFVEPADPVKGFVNRIVS